MLRYQLVCVTFAMVFLPCVWADDHDEAKSDENVAKALSKIAQAS